MQTTHHVGVYALWRHQGELVLVRKRRGPYTGLLDLPGGSPEPGEAVDEALTRELREETGADLLRVVARRPFHIHVQSDSAGRPIDLHHRGWIADVSVGGILREDIEEEDVAGVVLVGTPETHQELSPLVREALRLFPSLG